MANEPGNPQIKLDVWKLEEAAATEKIVETGEYTAKLGDRMAGKPGNGEIKGVEDTRKLEEAVGGQPERMQGVTENLIVTAKTREIKGFQQSYIDDLESHFSDLKKSPEDGAGDSGFYKVPEDLRKRDESLYQHAHVEFSKIMITKDDSDVGHYYNHLRSVLLQENGKKEENGKILEELLLMMENNEELTKWCAMKGNNSPDFPQFFGLLLSGCFIVDVFHKWHSLELSPGKDPKCGDEWASELWADLLLVENQIPFFILRGITQKLKEHQEEFPELEQLIFHYFKDFVPLNKPEGEEKKKPDQSDQKPTETHHLLDFVHDHLLPQEDKKNQVTSIFLTLVFVMIGAVCLYPSLAWIIIPLLCIFAPLLCVFYLLKYLFISPWKLVKYIFTKWLCCLKGDGKQWNFQGKSQTHKPVLQRAVPTATRLREAGIRFEPIEERGFVVEFKNGELRLPRLHVRNNTKKLLMNLIVWEQCHKKAVKYFINYAIFMDYLVNTSKDVEILIQSRVIEHSLGKEDDVVAVFNSLGKGQVYRRTDEEKYDFLPKLSEELNKYCENKFNNWRANLMSEYFKSPWAVISLLAGVFLILLTVTQTFFSAYSYFRPPN
ncbi:UPF0481 protein At3g47200-like [Aristolochia californica]|uniref:UPF0481 protein At3g47200-like n=1 Tax=Aristolochia californica TaxID=171875 RepID=UPI0035DA4B05